MHLTTLVEMLERELPETLDNESTRDNLARLYAERGCHADAAAAGGVEAKSESAATIAAALVGPSRSRKR